MERARSRAESEARQQEERRVAERRKNLIVLTMYHLLDHGYRGACESLASESGVQLADYVVADNVDLMTIVQEYEAYFEMRFDRKPKLVKKAVGQGVDVGAAGAAPAKKALTRVPSNGSIEQRRAAGAGDASAGGGAAAARRVSSGNGRPSAAAKPPRQATAANGSAPTAPSAPAGVDGLGLVGTAAGGAGGGAGGAAGGAGGVDAAAEDADGPGASTWENRLKKALPPHFHMHPELRDLGGWLMRDVVQANPNVGMSDIAELDGVKRVLSESLVLPLKYPDYFTGLLAPWRGVLLYGPPGTGKTMLAKAVASECETTFFNVSASTIVSKWRGDSEKLVRVLFELARHHAPSTVFIDEIDSLMSQRGDGGEHEGSRRMKTELLVQMDGLQTSAGAPGQRPTFVLGATNLPWELDGALLRRLEKRILVPRPGPSGRLWILNKLLTPERIEDGCRLAEVAERTDGYSGSDLVLVCKEAAMAPLRRLLTQLEVSRQADASASAATAPGAAARRGGGAVAGAQSGQHDPPPPVGKVTAEDIARALSRTRPTAVDASKYEAWAAEFGST